MKTAQYKVSPGKTLSLRKFASSDDGGFSKDDAEAKFEKLHERLIELTELLYADGRFGLLVVFQGMDTSGKDSTIRSVFGGVCPSGIDVTAFKRPSEEESRHDFLWRIHHHAPARGEISVFNRSHYEDVLIARVKGLAPPKTIESRYDAINAFESSLVAEGTHVVKFMLHISKGYQKERLQKRLDEPAKHWKFDPADLVERKNWGDYQKAFEIALSRCSTKGAPWYVVPAEKRWYRNLVITQVLLDLLESLKLRYPKPRFDPTRIRID